jgi:hypothetical protein
MRLYLSLTPIFPPSLFAWGQGVGCVYIRVRIDANMVPVLLVF